MRTCDRELVERTLAGERSAFAELIDRYRDAVCGIAYHHLGNFDDVQDAAQEAFIQAYLRLGQLREAERFGPWLRRIAVNASMDVLRNRGRTVVGLDKTDEKAALDSEDDQRKAAIWMIVQEALGRLSEKTRLTATLAYINGYSHAEIAEFLEVPVNTVRSRLQHAKKQLREEMIHMVSDMLHENKPSENFAKQLMETLQCALEAGKASPKNLVSYSDQMMGIMEKMNAGVSPEQYKKEILDAFRNFDLPPGEEEKSRRSAIEHLRSMNPQEMHLLLKIELLRSKGDAFRQMGQPNEATKSYEQALETANQLGDAGIQAEALDRVADHYLNIGERDKAKEYYRLAADAFQGIGSHADEAMSLWWLGALCMSANEVDEGKRHVEKALGLFESANKRDGAAMCRGMLGLLTDVGEAKYSTIASWSAGCPILERKSGAISLQFETAYTYNADRPEEVPALRILHIFSQAALLQKLYDSGVPVGGSWLGNIDWSPRFSLKGTATVKSNDENVTVPAGVFEGCLLIEQEVTTKDNSSSDIPDHIRRFLQGTRRSWYAPGIGLVQLYVKTDGGIEALIQLREFTVQTESNDYLPLAVGNSWTYGWADLPPEWVAKEVYRVLANDGDMWYLEQYGYAYKE